MNEKLYLNIGAMVAQISTLQEQLESKTKLLADAVPLIKKLPDACHRKLSEIEAQSVSDAAGYFLEAAKA